MTALKSKCESLQGLQQRISDLFPRFCLEAGGKRSTRNDKLSTPELTILKTSSHMLLKLPGGAPIPGLTHAAMGCNQGTTAAISAPSSNPASWTV